MTIFTPEFIAEQEKMAKKPTWQKLVVEYQAMKGGEG